MKSKPNAGYFRLKGVVRVAFALICLRFLYLFFSDPTSKFSDEAINLKKKAEERQNIIHAARLREQEWRQRENIQNETLYQSDQPDDLYIQPDFTRVSPEFSKSRRIVIDYPFHHFEDAYGLINSGMNKSEMVERLREVSNIWIKGNIWVRFKIGDVLNAKSLLLGKADAYKWWVVAPKHDSEKYLQGVQELANGPGRLGEENAKLVTEKLINQFNGHSLMNWVLDIGAGDKDIVFYHVYTMYYYPWYNGGTSRGRIFVRSGSCVGDESSKKRIGNEIVKCRGWNLDEEQGNFEGATFVRVLAHEVGHSLGLQHPSRTCQVVPKAEDMDLMRQQRAVTTAKIGKCSPNNPVAKYSRHVSNKEYARARVNAASKEKKQKAYYHLHPEVKSQPLSLNQFRTQV